MVLVIPFLKNYKTFFFVKKQKKVLALGVKMRLTKFKSTDLRKIFDMIFGFDEIIDFRVYYNISILKIWDKNT